MNSIQIKKPFAFLLSGLLLLGSLSGCNSPVSVDRESAGPSVSSQASGGTSQPLSAPATVDTSGATTITLSGDSAFVQGPGAAADGGVITVSAGGVYTVSGTLNDGRILVDAKGEEVTLVLNGAELTCSWGSPLYIYRAKLATVHLQAGTDNTLTDGVSYTYADSYSSAAEEEPNACLYSKADLVLQGAGSLTVNGNCNNGITGKDTLLLRDGSITVNAVNHGVNGKDSNTLNSVTLTVTCGGDAVRSTNDTDSALGWVSITDANLTLTAGEDGVQAETWACIQGGTYAVTTGGGSAATLTGDGSAKGVKAGGELTLLGGSFVMDCADDAFHSNASLTVSDGVYTVATGDDAFHADETLTVSGGTIDVTASYEGLEGSDVNLTGGTISLVSSDDGVNAAGGADGSGFLDRGGMAKGGFGGSGNHTLTVSGGTLKVVAGGDGLDANGALVITGGELTVYNISGGNGALDSDGGVTLEGGVVFAATGGNMPQAPASPGQCTLYIGLGQTLPAGSVLTIAGSGYSYTYTLESPAVSIVFSAPELQSGDACTVTCGGETLAQVTLNEGLTSSGQAAAGAGMPGGKGGMDGHAGWKQFDAAPPEGDFPGRDQMQPSEGEQMQPPQGELPNGEQMQPPGGQGGFPGRGGAREERGAAPSAPPA